MSLHLNENRLMKQKSFDTLIVIDLRDYKLLVKRFLPSFSKIAFELCCDSKN